MWTSKPRQAGVTLVELIVAMVIVGIALAGLAMVLARTSTASVDPMIAQQKVAIAESLMGEIVLRRFAIDDTAVVPGVRSSFTDVGDFNNYSTTGVVDPDNTPVPGLGNYLVSVRVTPVAFGTGVGAVAVGNPADLYAAANDALRIDVTVRRTDEPAAAAFVLSGWRFRPERP